MSAQARVLFGDAVHKARVLGIRRVVFRLVAEEVEAKVEVDFVSGDTQVVKARAEEGDVGDVAFERMFGGDLGDDAIGGDDVEDVEVFDDRGGQGAPAMAGLNFAVAGDLGVSGAIGDDRLETIFLGLLGEISPL